MLASFLLSLLPRKSTLRDNTEHMTTDIFLILPTTPSAPAPETLLQVLATTPVAALLLLRGDMDADAYESLAKTIIPIAQAEDCALLIDGDADMAIRLDADGAHISTGIKDFKAALDKLKAKGMICGAGAIHSRHDGMLKAEAGADYVMFGPVAGRASTDDRDSAAWWTGTFEVPCVFSDPEAGPDEIDAGAAEFFGCGAAIWHAPNPPAALEAIRKALDVAQ